MRKRTLVTGSSGGIGRAIALRLAKDGCDIGIHYAHDELRARQTAAECSLFGARAETFCANAENTAEMKKLVADFIAAFGGIDLLVNNVGITICRPFLEVTEELFDRLVNADLKSHYFTAQAAARDMIARGQGGCIINITSLQQSTCFPETSVYGSMKAAFAKLTTHMAVELAPYGIRVNAVAPGTIYTGEGEPNARMRYLLSRIPVGRLGTPQDVAAAVAFVASEEASFMQGANLLIDGGALSPSFIDNLYTPRVATDKMG